MRVGFIERGKGTQVGRLSSVPRPMAREAPTAERKLSAVECNNCYLL